MRLLLIRHGITDTTGVRLTGRTPGVDLNERGQKQAQAVSERLSSVKMKVGAIYSSPMERCRQTAAPLASALHQRVKIERRINELDVGDWKGRKLSDLARTKRWTQVQLQPSLFAFPNGESVVDAQQRIVDFVEAKRLEHNDETVACFSHADLIKLLIAHYAGMHIDQYQRLVVEPGSLSILAVTNSGSRLERLNDTGQNL